MPSVDFGFAEVLASPQGSVKNQSSKINTHHSSTCPVIAFRRRRIFCARRPRIQDVTKSAESRGARPFTRRIAWGAALYAPNRVGRSPLRAESRGARPFTRRPSKTVPRFPDPPEAHNADGNSQTTPTPKDTPPVPDRSDHETPINPSSCTSAWGECS